MFEKYKGYHSMHSRVNGRLFEKRVFDNALIDQTYRYAGEIEDPISYLNPKLEENALKPMIYADYIGAHQDSSFNHRDITADSYSQRELESISYPDGLARSENQKSILRDEESKAYSEEIKYIDSQIQYYRNLIKSGELDDMEVIEAENSIRQFEYQLENLYKKKNPQYVIEKRMNQMVELLSESLGKEPPKLPGDNPRHAPVVFGGHAPARATTKPSKMRLGPDSLTGDPLQDWRYLISDQDEMNADQKEIASEFEQEVLYYLKMYDSGSLTYQELESILESGVNELKDVLKPAPAPDERGGERGGEEKGEELEFTEEDDQKDIVDAIVDFYFSGMIVPADDLAYLEDIVEEYIDGGITKEQLLYEASDIQLFLNVSDLWDFKDFNPSMLQEDIFTYLQDTAFSDVVFTDDEADELNNIIDAFKLGVRAMGDGRGRTLLRLIQFRENVDRRISGLLGGGGGDDDDKDDDGGKGAEPLEEKEEEEFKEATKEINRQLNALKLNLETLAKFDSRYQPLLIKLEDLRYKQTEQDIKDKDLVKNLEALQRIYDEINLEYIDITSNTKSLPPAAKAIYNLEIKNLTNYDFNDFTVNSVNNYLKNTVRKYEFNDVSSKDFTRESIDKEFKGGPQEIYNIVRVINEIGIEKRDFVIDEATLNKIKDYASQKSKTKEVKKYNYSHIRDFVKKNILA